MIALAQAVWLEASYVANQSKPIMERWSQNRPNWFHDGEMYDRYTMRTYNPTLATMQSEFRRAAQ